MSFSLGPDGSPTPIYYPDDPQIQEEDRQERFFKATARVLKDEQYYQEERRQSKMSYAQKLQEFGDYLPEDSGMNNGDHRE